MLKKSIGVIVAHPDDEVLGFCGTMLKEIDLGNKVYVLFLSTGLSSRENNTDKKDILSLRQTALEVSKKIGVTQTIFEEFPDNNMDSVPLLSVVKKVEKFLIEFKINEIYTHYINDLNIDHQITAKAVLTAARPLPKNNVTRILSGEVLSSSEYTEFNQRFTPNVFVNIEKYIDKKVDILRLYKNELRDWPHPRSLQAVKNLAEMRGSEIGIKGAEAFLLLRDIIK